MGHQHFNGLKTALLYTVRDLMKADLPGTLARVAALGYKEVEFAGYFGRSPAEIRDLLAKNGLTSPSSHIPLEVMRANADKAFSDAKTIGHQWVTVPWLDEKERGTLANWKSLAAEFNRLAAQARTRGLRFAYHNHDFEQKKVEGATPLDVLISETDPALVDFEMDLYWMVEGGADPLDYFRRFPHRFPLVHVKDSAGPPEHRMVSVGQGTIDFRSIFAQTDLAGIQHYFVEHDNPTDAMASIATSYAYLSTLEF